MTREVEPRWKAGPSKPKRPRRLPAYSAKRFSKKELRARLVEQVFARDNHQCRAARTVPAVRCAGPLDPHEVIPRSAWADGYLVKWNVISICRAHHDWVGDNPMEAARLGLHGWSWDVPCRKRDAS